MLEIKDLIDNISLGNCFEEIQFSKIFTIELCHLEGNKLNKRNVIKNFLIFIQRCICDRYVFEENVEDKKDVLFFYGKYWWREDHQQTFCNFTSRFVNYGCIFGKKQKISFNFDFINRLWFGIKWLFKSAKYIPIPLSMYLLPNIDMIFYMNQLVKKIDFSDYKLVVVYSELSPDENFLVQYAKKMGLKTATLQHGVFVARKNDSQPVDRGIQLRESIVDYFLAWNKFTEDNAILEGMNPEKIFTLGIPKFINYASKPEIDTIKKDIFGVVLNGFTPEFDAQNREMIRYANQIADRLNIKYILRYHPDMKGYEYANLCTTRCCGINDDKSISEYAKKVDFSIVDASSVFIELVFIKHPVFRISNAKDDVYSTLSIDGAFSTVDELERLINTKNVISERAFDYLCNTNDVFDSYNHFFKNIVRCGEDE